MTPSILSWSMASITVRSWTPAQSGAEAQQPSTQIKNEKNQCVNYVSYDTEHALLQYGPNPTLQILIAKKKTATRPETFDPSQKNCAGDEFGH